MPDVRFRADVTVSFVSPASGSGTLALYDLYGRFSTLGISLNFDPGLRALITQRLERIPGDADDDAFDEYFVEDPGIWRAGKQVLPFGSGRLIRESVLAVRGDTNLIFENLPVSVALCEGPSGTQSGVIGRVGSRLGFSAAFGRHFGIAGSSLTYVRRPDDSPGPGRGYRQMFGADFSRSFGAVTIRSEVVVLRDGETVLDRDDSVVDFTALVRSSPSVIAGMGFTYSDAQSALYTRVFGSLRVTREASVEPSIRLRKGNFFDLAIALRVRF